MYALAAPQEMNMCVFDRKNRGGEPVFETDFDETLPVPPILCSVFLSFSMSSKKKIDQKVQQKSKSFLKDDIREVFFGRFV